MAKYLDKSGVTYLWNKIKGLFTDQSLNTKNKTYAGAINEINTKVGNLTGAFLWKGKFDALPAVINYEAGNVVGIGKKEYVLTVTEGTKTWEEFGDEGSYLLKTAAEETYLKKAAGEVKTANLVDKAVTENKLNDDLRSKVNDNVKTITQTLTDTQKDQARQNIDVLEITQQDIDNLPGGGLDPISDNTTPEVQGIETLLGFDVNGNISKTKTIDTKHLATGSVTKEKLDSGLRNSIGTKAIRINYGDVEAAKAALEEYNADPNKTVILVNYKSIRVPASVSGTFIVALVTEGSNERKLLYKNGEWNDSVIFNHSSVLYTTQDLTDVQKKTARDNIGASNFIPTDSRIINDLLYYTDKLPTLPSAVSFKDVISTIEGYFPLVFSTPGGAGPLSRKYYHRVMSLTEGQYAAIVDLLKKDFSSYVGDNFVIKAVYEKSESMASSYASRGITVGDSIDLIEICIVSRPNGKVYIIKLK